jgi:hypothetical protein
MTYVGLYFSNRAFVAPESLGISQCGEVRGDLPQVTFFTTQKDPFFVLALSESTTRGLGVDDMSDCRAHQACS